MQSLLSEWRAELARQPLALSEADACAVLGLKPGPDGRVAEDELRRAYRYGAKARELHTGVLCVCAVCSVRAEATEGGRRRAAQGLQV